MITIDITDDSLQSALKALSEKYADLSPIMAGIAQDLHGGVEDEFRTEGQGSWPQLAISTQKQRARKYGAGKAAHPMLIRRGDLVRRIVAGHDDSSAWVSTNDVRAPILHFGGTIAMPARSQFTRKAKAGKNKGRTLFSTLAKSEIGAGRTIGAHTITIPPRPFMVIRPETLDAVMDTIGKFLSA